MAHRKSDFSEGKQNIILALLQKYDIYIHDALKDLLGGTI